MSEPPSTVFVSYTAEDLAAHADVVVAVLRKLGLLAIDHRDVGAEGTPSVEWCYDKIAQSDILVVLVAHRYGWVPPTEQGGDGSTSITGLEVRHAHKLGKIVLPYLIKPDAMWRSDRMEGLGNPIALDRLQKLKAELGKTIAGFFTDPESLDGPVSRNVRDALDRLKRRRPSSSPPAAPAPAATSQSIRPWIFSRADPPSVEERLAGAHPKRVLCLDSANVEIALTLGWLERLESLLRARYREPDFSLSDYFDLIAGSGFGAIVAADLALGLSLSEITAFFREHIGHVLGRRRLIPWKSGYDSAPFEALLKNRYGTLTIATAPWQTGLVLLGTQLERGLTCHFSNHPSELNSQGEPAPALSTLVYGCNAQVSYFPPALIERPDGSASALCAADITGAANPSLYVLQLVAGVNSTESGAPAFHWRLGRYEISIFSIGGFEYRRRANAREVAEANLLTQIPLVVNSLLQGTSHAARLVLQTLSGDSSAPFSFHRFEASSASLPNEPLLGRLDDMTWEARLEQWSNLESIGRRLGIETMQPSVLSPAFDVRIVEEPKLPGTSIVSG